MPRGSKPGERRGGRQRAAPNKRTILTDRILAAASEYPSSSWHELLAILVKDQALPADIRIAVARTSLPARALSVRLPAGPVTLDVLLSVVQDTTTAPAQRRKVALEVALHFLPKNPARGWPGSIADEFGFVISPKMAREYRDSKLQLRHLSDSAGSNVPATQKKADKLRARIEMILQRLECPCPARYNIEQWRKDRERVLELVQRRQSKIVLTEEENAEEAHLVARSDSLLAGAAEAAKERLYDLREKARLSKNGAGRRLTRQEQANLRLLRLLYPSSPFFSYDPDEDLQYHPLRDELFAEDGNLYPRNSRLRPVPSSPEDADFVEFVDVPRYITGNPNYP